MDGTAVAGGAAEAEALVAQLVAKLPKAAPGLFNPYEDRCELDLAPDAAAQRRLRLAAHLDCTPKYLLIGEAPGYQGCRYSGIAFTSERLLLEGAIPRVPALPGRLTSRHLPWSEPSATVVWGVLRALGIAESTVLWNALQLHPYEVLVGGAARNHSNRTPSADEIALGRPALEHLVARFAQAKVVAVGRSAAAALARAGIPALGVVRHPANGGARLFAEGLAALVGSEY